MLHTRLAREEAEGLLEAAERKAAARAGLVARVVALRREGLSNRLISVRLGLSKTTVGQYLLEATGSSAGAAQEYRRTHQRRAPSGTFLPVEKRTGE